VKAILDTFPNFDCRPDATLPQERMMGCVARQFGCADHLASVIDVVSNVTRDSSKAAEVSRLALSQSTV